MDKQPMSNAGRAQEAELLLKNDLFREILAEAEAELIKEWSTGVANSTEKREAAFYNVQAVKNVRHRLEKLIEKARFEANQASKKTNK
jgi:hypothetical protein